MNTPTHFSNADLNAMKALLEQKDRIPNNDPYAQTRSEHVEHALQQLIRFANLAENHNSWRAAQFGLNLGRAQELLGSHGGVGHWWRVYEPLIESRNWKAIQEETLHRLLILGLRTPTVEFINRL